MSEQQNAKQTADLARSARWSGAVSLSIGAGNLFTLLVLTRLLDPADFGTPALGLAMLGFTLLFVQNGLPGALIFLQERDGTRLSGLFWSNVALGAAAGLLLWLLRTPAATFFGDARLGGVLAWMAVLPVFCAAGAIYKSIQLRDLAYRHSAGAELSAFLAGAVTAVYMALKGYGYWALVGQMIAKYAAEYTCYIVAGWKGFRPGLRWTRRQLLQHYRFAWAQGGERLTMYLNANWDTLLIGKLLGPGVLGLYDVFKRLIARPSSLAGEWVDRFAFPLMARAQGNREVLSALYLGHLRLLAKLLAPFSLFGLAFAEPLLVQLSGSQWAALAHVFRLLLAAFAINALLHPLDNLLAAVGKIHRLGYANLIWAAVSIPALVLGGRWGLEGVAAAQLAVAVLVQYPAFRYLIQPEIHMPMAAYFKVPAKEIFLSVLALIPAWGVFAGLRTIWPAGAPWAAAAIYGAVAGVLLRGRKVEG